jgi:hypothetical protein
VTDKEYRAAMASMGVAASRVVDEIALEVLMDAREFVAPRTTHRSRAERFEALQNPKSVRDYEETMTAEEFMEECRLRGIMTPAWWPRP